VQKLLTPADKPACSIPRFNNETAGETWWLSLGKARASLVVRNFLWSLDFKLFRRKILELFVPNDTFRRWTADDFAKLKNLAQKQTWKAIATELG
jgi:hypothetical protein